MTRSTEHERWCIVGGGFLGLTMAHRLARTGRQVTVLEASDQIGGLADAWELGPVRWDRHYHVTLLSDSHLRGLLAELGLDDSIRWSTTRTDFYAAGRFFPLNTALDYLRLPVVGFIDKIRLAFTILYASRLTDGRRLEAIRLDDWLLRLSGRSNFETIWLPLLRAKLGENYKHASAAFIWAVIRRLYAARRSGLKREMFGYVEGGYGNILDRFKQLLASDGVECRTGMPVTGIHRNQEQLVVSTAAGKSVYDRVVVTVPASQASRMCQDFTAAEVNALEGILYQGIVCASVLLRKPLRGAYLTYITDPEAPFTAVVEMSSLVDPEELGGHTLVYLPRYVASDDPFFETPDAEIEKRFLDGLFSMYPDLTQDDVVAFRLSRVRRVLAISTLDYSEHLPEIATSVPGLYVVNSAHIVNGTLNVNETVNLANEATEHLVEMSDKLGVETGEHHSEMAL